MDIVILGAIPHDLMAKESEAYIEKQAPVFTRLLQTHKASTEWLDIETIGCTPYEYYQLKKANYQGENNFYAKGTAPLYASTHFNTFPSHQAVYLMELTYVEIGQHHASLYTSDELNITPDEAKALFDSSIEVLAHSPYRLLQHNNNMALMDMGDNFTLPLFSPSLLATGHLNDWHQLGDLARPLRNVLAELQILWYNHPINQARQARGLKPINSAWIYGGACFNEIHPASSPTEKVLSQLSKVHLHQDWGRWIAELATLDTQLAPLSQSSHRYILFGFDRIVTLTPKPFWAKLINNKSEWKQWWSQSK